MFIHWYIFMVSLHSIWSLPQTKLFKMPNVDFSTAQEINGLEPSPTPELESRSYNNNGNFLEATLEEVQNILKTSPNLPRLTKGEILDLIENITKQDMEKLRSLNKNRNGKSVLLVMPYSPKKNGENMEDLYTKKPVTQLIENDNATIENKKENRKKKPSFSFTKDNNKIFGRNVTKMSYKLTFPTTHPTEKTSDIPYDTTFPMTTESSIEVTTFRRRVRPTRIRPPTVTRPTRRRRKPTSTPTSIQTEQEHHTDKFLPENAIRVTKPPVYRFTRRTTTTTTSEVPDLNTAESYQSNVYVNPPSLGVPSSEFDHIISSFQQDELNQAAPVFKPISNQLFRDEEENIPSLSSTSKPFSDSFIIPEGFNHIIRNMDLDSAANREKILEEAIRSNTALPVAITTTNTPYQITPRPEFVADNLSPDMKNLLMTFGLIPNPEYKKDTRQEELPFRSEQIEEHPESYLGFKPLPEDGAPNKDLDDLLASFGLGRSARKSKKIKKRIDVNPGLDLSMIPESMKGVVSNLGLSTEIIEDPSREKTDSLNTTVVTSNNERMDDIYENGNVTPVDIEEKDVLNNENATLLVELPSEENLTLSAHLEEIPKTNHPLVSNPELLELDEIINATNNLVDDNDTNELLIDNESQRNDVTINITNIETTTKGTSTSVVFNPTDQKIVEREKEQLEKLVELIKTLKAINGSATEKDFENVELETLKEFTKVLNESQRTTVGEQIDNEINPLYNFDDIAKLNLKREEATTVGSASTEDITESKIEPLLLEESFGKLPEVETETSTPKTYSSGVYYMIDWNTFLEVDNTKGTHVNLRFQPKVGDPGRFYSINNN